MARARNIKPSFFKNEDIGSADPLVGLLFISLWTLADKEGRLEDRPLRIRAETFPYRENIDINGYLTQLVSFGLIERYKCDGLAVIQIVTFEKHQSPHSTEKKSVFPKKPDELPAKPIESTITVKQPLNNASACVNPDINVLNPESLFIDSLNPECGILNGENAAVAAPPTLPPAEKPKPENPRGTRLSKTWALPDDWADDAKRLRPELDPRTLADGFRDYWVAATGAKASKADWQATWRNWVRSQNPMRGAAPPRYGGKLQGDAFTQATKESYDRAIARHVKPLRDVTHETETPEAA